MMERTKLLILRLTDRCNLACKYCYAGSSSGMDMPLDTAVKAIGLFARPGDKLKIQFTGGEPLLCLGRMKDIFRYGKQEGIQMVFSLQTNGTLLSREACAALKEMRCAVGVSLDGIGAANSLRIYPDGSPAFEDVLTGVRTLAAFGMHCNLNAVVSRANQAHLHELVELAAYLPNVRGVGLDMFRPIGRGAGGEYTQDTATLGDDIMRMLARRAELHALGVNVRVKELEKVRAMVQNGVRETCYCYAETGFSAAVDPRGDVYPCSSFVGMEGMRLGNVETGVRFAPAAPAMCEVCKGCEDAPLCRGGCPAGRAASGGRNEADCIMHRTIIEYGRKEYA